MYASVIRDPAVAGLFYPADPAELRAEVDRMLADAGARARPGEPTQVPRAVVVPHAGYVYSGPTAALAFALVAGAAVERVVLVGPTHRVAVRGVALPGANAFATPLGLVRVPHQWAAELLGELPTVCVHPGAHRDEHSVEVQLPFLQRALGDVEVLPLLAGDASGAEVADVLDALDAFAAGTLVVISSDLSHYLPYEEARHADARTLAQIADLAGPLDHDQACGATPVNGLLVAARRHGLRPTLLGACSSGDTAGDRRRVVGYSAWAFDA